MLRNNTDARRYSYAENFRCNLTYYESENFSDSSSPSNWQETVFGCPWDMKRTSHYANFSETSWSPHRMDYFALGRNSGISSPEVVLFESTVRSDRNLPFHLQKFSFPVPPNKEVIKILVEMQMKFFNPVCTLFWCNSFHAIFPRVPKQSACYNGEHLKI